MARRASAGSADEPKSLRRTILEILLGGGLLAASIPFAEKYFDDDTDCLAAYRSVDSIKRVEEVSSEFRPSYVRHMRHQLKMAEKCDREAGQ